MTKKFSLPRGTADILPDETPLWRDIEDKARKIFAIYGYQEIRTPVFEETALFTRSLGETSDVVQKQMLNLEKEGLALRPEGTASIVRSYIENNLDKKERLSKLYYIGSMFRGERPQKGRLRQFHQIGVEAIGPNSSLPYLDAEVIILAVNLLKSFGLNDFKLKINTLGSPEDKENFSKILRGELKNKSAHLCEDCQNRLERNVFRILDCKNEQCKKIVGELKIGSSYLSEASKTYFKNVKDALEFSSVAYEESSQLVRGLDYYTHTVFEISSPSLGSQDALGAGGRYNNLVSQLGGPEVDGIGFAMGVERILLALSQDPSFVKASLNCLILSLDEASLLRAFQILSILRSAGISSDMSHRFGSMKNQMSFADKIGARYVMILGEDEAKKGTVTLKNMATREQNEIKASADNLTEVIKILKEE